MDLYSSIHISDVSTFIELFPSWDYSENKILHQDNFRSLAGDLKTIAYDSYNTYTLPLTYVNSSIKSFINDLWQNQTKVFLVFNFPNSRENVPCRFENQLVPLGTFNIPYDNEWQGVVQLRSIGNTILGEFFTLGVSSLGGEDKLS